ncbi:MAG: hypothetical protein AAF518_11755 [Spirochaetota bacterium]
MNFLYIPIIFLIYSIAFSLHAVEIVFHNGQAYIGELVSEDERVVRIRFRNELYTIPKEDLSKIDISKKGDNLSYNYTEFTLKDGSKVKGIIAEEKQQSYTLKTKEFGFLVLEKDRIVKSKRAEDSKTPPKKYLGERQVGSETLIGITGTALGGYPGPAFGGGLYIEPAFLKLFGIQLGYKGEYLSALKANSRYTFFNNYGYMHFSTKINDDPFWDFYSNIGIGGSIVQYKSDNQTLTGGSPSGYIELGWQGIRWKSLVTRIGIRGLCSAERGNPYCMGGGELSVGVSF